jgi:DNA-binding transcriptional MerR regulator
MNGMRDPSFKRYFELCPKGRLKLGFSKSSRWLRIGEFARLAGVSVKTARYYAGSQLLVPAYTDPSTSYRFYRLDQVPVLQRIRHLRALGLSIAELRSWLSLPEGAVERLGLLEILKSRVQVQMTADAQRLDALQLLIDEEFQVHGPRVPVDPAERPLPQVAAYTIREPGRCTAHAIYEMFESAELHVANYSARSNRPPFLMVHGAHYGEPHRDVEVCIPILKRCIGAAGGRMIQGTKRAACERFGGPYNQGAAVFEGMRRWIGSSGRRATGPVREVYWRYGADQNGYSVPKTQLARAPADYLTEIQIPLAAWR